MSTIIEQVGLKISSHHVVLVCSTIIFLICWSLIRNGSLLLLYNVQPQVLNLYLKVILVTSMSDFIVLEVHTIILDFSRSRFLSTFVINILGYTTKNMISKLDPLRVYWGLGGRLLACATRDPHSRSSLLVSSLWIMTSMKQRLSFSFCAVAIASTSSSSVRTYTIRSWYEYLFVTKVKVDLCLDWHHIGPP